MSGLSTKEVKTGGGGLPKTIAPGEHKLKINSVELKRFSFMEQDNGYYLILNVETEPIEGFQGFFIDINDQSKGQYTGQIGQIKTNAYYYKDGETKSGIKVERDMEILKQIKNICIASDKLDWFDAVDGKYDTIEEFIAGFNTAKITEGKLYKFCVAGKEFERNNGYTGFDLFLPKLNRGTVAFEIADAKISKVITYNESTMLEKLSPTEVKNFGADDDLNSKPASGDDLLDGAPEFEL
jgi:hypothetical protein